MSHKNFALALQDAKNSEDPVADALRPVHQLHGWTDPYSVPALRWH